VAEIQLESFLQDISDKEPCGADVRNLEESNEAFKKYFELRAIRNDQRRQERKNIETAETLLIEPKEWHEVIRLASELLSQHTKDLEIGAWLIEGLIRVQQFKGLALGFQILEGLLSKYQNNLYPKAEDDEENSARLTSIAMLGGKYELGSLVVPVYYHTILPTTSGLSLNAWTIRHMLDKSEDTRIEALMECEGLKKAILELDKDSFAFIAKDLAASKEAFIEFNGALGRVFSKDAPNVMGLSEALLYCCGIAFSVQSFLDKAAKANQVEINSSAQQSATSATFSLENFSYENLTRDSAISLICAIAKFFEASEPHSPISYSLNRLVGWANLDLPMLLQNIGIDPHAQEEYCKITGVPFLSKGGGSYDDG
jgi:type VI secretion system protein ImpA